MEEESPCLAAERAEAVENLIGRSALYVLEFRAGAVRHMWHLNFEILAVNRLSSQPFRIFLQRWNFLTPCRDDERDSIFFNKSLALEMVPMVCAPSLY